MSHFMRYTKPTYQRVVQLTEDNMVQVAFELQERTKDGDLYTVAWDRPRSHYQTGGAPELTLFCGSRKVGVAGTWINENGYRASVDGWEPVDEDPQLELDDENLETR